MATLFILIKCWFNNDFIDLTKDHWSITFSLKCTHLYILSSNLIEMASVSFSHIELKVFTQSETMWKGQNDSATYHKGFFFLVSVRVCWHYLFCSVPAHTMLQSLFSLHFSSFFILNLLFLPSLVSSVFFRVNKQMSNWPHFFCWFYVNNESATVCD